jgi:LmbE family N-acetylglucosaminyl deacetylase
MKNNVLAIGAHPDDVEMGCGGTLLKHLQLGDNVYALILTNGEKGNHDHHRDECLKSLKKIGIKKQNIFFGNLRDGFVKDDNETISLIENFIRKLEINKVYTHYFSDRHQDHRNTSLAVSAAARKVNEIFLFQGPSTLSNFEPHYFIEIPIAALKIKLKAIEKYKSQIRKGIVNIEWLKDVAVVNGVFGNVKYAEAFAINHVVKGGGNV